MKREQIDFGIALGAERLIGVICATGDSEALAFAKIIKHYILGYISHPYAERQPFSHSDAGR